MSTYNKITRHPQTGKWENALWIDDYFGHHIYGVEFKSDSKVYPIDLINSKDIKNFWAEDVKNAFCVYLEDPNIKNPYYMPNELSIFLNLVEEEYKKRWKEDPLGGNGAVEDRIKSRA